MANFTNEDVISALRQVNHPEKGSDIVTLGIVGDINISDDGIKIELTPEKSNDPFLSSIRSSCVRALKDSLGSEVVISSIDVKPKIIVGKAEAPKREVLPGVRNIIAVSSPREVKL